MGDNRNGKHVKLSYQSGFGNHFATEAVPGSLPKGQNTPQACPHGLYAEQLSGTAFTVPREHNQRTWLYRIRPSVVQARFHPVADPPTAFKQECRVINPEQMRWGPQPLPASDKTVDFIEGMVTIAGAGDPTMKSGLAIHMYTANASMVDTAFQNSDGDFLIIPQLGTLHIRTEMGLLDVEPHEIVVIPRGIRFQIGVDEPVRGYILEIYQSHFQLPQLGPIGANGLANPRDFLYPVAAFEDREASNFRVVNKFGGHLFEAALTHSPFNVVAWHGNYAPYKYNLDDFNCMNSVTYDHPDPSIYTVLTCPSGEPGVAVADFVIFPPRWMVMEKSFRPPYYHRNTMTEYMGMVYGKYDAKTGFVPGGGSLHSCMTPHGPDTETFNKASAEDLKPVKFDGGLAFMFETTYILKMTDYAFQAPHREVDYVDCWSGLPKLFNAASASTAQEQDT